MRCDLPPTTSGSHSSVAADAPMEPTDSTAARSLCLKRKSPGSGRMTPVASSHTIVRVVENSILRSLAFVLYHLDRTQARYCVQSILQWYGHLQTKLPLFAVDSLDQFATSFVALSDAEFTAFWLSLVDEPGGGRPPSHGSDGIPTDARCIAIATGDEYEDEEDAVPDMHDRDATLIERLYRQICGRIQRLFGLPTCVHPRDELRYAQTPVTSPDDKYDERQFYRRRASLSRAVASARHAGVHECDDVDNDGTMLLLQATASTSTVAADSAIRSEPGWAVEYMEQESKVSSEMTQRMRRMMHSSIPLNLFRVAVVYPPRVDGMGHEDEDAFMAAGFVGVVSPDSFPPTPITRDLQTRRIHHYTANVLDHATLALRLLDTNYAA